MRFGLCKWFLEKSNRLDWINFVIENVIKKSGYNVINPYFNCVCFFDNMGEEVRCSEKELSLITCSTYDTINLILWKKDESIDVEFDRSDKNYDMFCLDVNIIDTVECNELINIVTSSLIESDLNLKGFIFDKNGILYEFYDQNDDQYLDFAFNEKSDIRKKLKGFYKYSSHICDEFGFPVLTENNINNIYTYVFLGGEVREDTFDRRKADINEWFC